MPIDTHVIVIESGAASMTARATRSGGTVRRDAVSDPMRSDVSSPTQCDGTIAAASVTGLSASVADVCLAPAIDQCPANIVATSSRTAPA